MITHDDAIAFLKANQPLPSDDLLEENIQTFREVKEFFIENPDAECIPLFLNCFGEGSGFGLYQTIDDLISSYDDGLVVIHLKNSLFSQIASVRYWCAQICENYEYSDLIDGLIYVYDNGDADSKCAALTSLSTFEDERVKSLAKRALIQESDADLLEIASDIATS